MADIKYDIIENLGVLSETDKGWKKELNLISWNDKEAKYDIRDWDENHEKMGKGNTFTKDELMELRDILNNDEYFNTKLQNNEDESQIHRCNYVMIDDKGIEITINYIKIYTNFTYELNFTCTNYLENHINFEINNLTIDKEIYEPEKLGSINRGTLTTSMTLILDNAVDSITFCAKASDESSDSLSTQFVKMNFDFDFEEDTFKCNIENLSVQDYYAFIETNV